MNIISRYLLTPFIIITALNSCSPSKLDEVQVTSPDGRMSMELEMIDGHPVYRAFFDGNEIIGKSAMGFIFSDKDKGERQLTIISVKEKEVDRNWNPVYGERDEYPDRYHEAIVAFESGDPNTPAFQLRMRAYNEGIGFRYEFESNEEVAILSERTEFALPSDAKVWVSDRAQSAISKRAITELEDKAVERPLLAQLEDSVFVAIGEAALVDFARMKLMPKQNRSGTLVASLDGGVVFDRAFASPWRIIMAGRTPGELLENNYLLLNLNEASHIANPEWVKPGKVIREVTLTTQGGMACVDFAAAHNLQYIEFDAGWYGHEYDDASDATTVTVDPKRSKGPLDLQGVIKYAETKDIGVLLYVNMRALDKQIDDVLPLLQSWGVKGVKYGFVNVGSQEWTSWLHEAVRKAADHELMIDIHDEYRPTGYSRTYPNLMTQEGIRGDEESPDNAMVLNTLFVRMLAGAGDHTNCYFAERVEEKMGSHASQLAKAVCIYSPWQFLYWYDRPASAPNKAGGAGDNERYITEVPELTFFDQLPTVWDDTKVVDGYPGTHAVVARRSATTWYVGVLNGVEEREYSIPFDFLDEGSQYEATIFADDQETNTRTKVAVTTRSLTANDILNYNLKGNEGMAMIIKKVN